MKEDIREFFRERDDAFTVYVVDHQFANDRGLEYFKSFKGKVNYIDTDAIIKKRIDKILRVINRNIPETGSLIKGIFKTSTTGTPMGIVDAISSLSKIFTTTLNQAAGPDVIDPIILQEGKILPKYLNQIITLHESSILRPVIIILLQDNDFERAKRLLSNCPHDTNIKMIRNSGESSIYKVINSGLHDIDTFLDSFSLQLFSSCSNTKRDVLYSNEWAKESAIRLFSPSLMHIRASFLSKDKTAVRGELNALIGELTVKQNEATDDFSIKMMLSFECMARLFRVFCNDGGLDDIQKAEKIARYLGNDILLAHVYRNSYFLTKSYEKRQELLDISILTFEKENMKDHAIYARNNKLVEQYEQSNAEVGEFASLIADAVHNIPGMVGMSHLLNNAGVIHLVNGHPDNAMDFFTKGLDYAYRPKRILQKISLLCNTLMTLSYSYEKIQEKQIRQIMNLVFDNHSVMNLPFIAARYALNSISLAASEHKDFALSLLEEYNIQELLQRALDDNELGSGQIILHAHVLNKKIPAIDLIEKLEIPRYLLEVKGKRRSFIEKHGYNPFVFSGKSRTLCKL